MFTTRKLIAVIIAVIMGLSICLLTACNGVGDDSSSSGSGAVSSSTASGGDESSSSQTPVKTYEVLFGRNCDDSTVVEPDVQLVEEGKKATRPADLKRNGYEMVGWYIDEEGTVEFDFDTPITEETILYAKWAVAVRRFIVDFDLMGASGAIEAQTVIEGEKVERPDDPQRSGFRFDGWFIDEGCNTSYNFDNAVSAEFTLYAGWTQLVTVTFNANYTGGTHSSQIIVKGGTPAHPDEPEREGYLFTGWYTDPGASVAYVFGAVDADLTVYAGWAPETEPTVTVIYDFNYVGSPAAVEKTVTVGSVAYAPEAVREGYVFVGWFTDPACTTAYDATAAVNEDKTVYAGWIVERIVTIDHNYVGSPDPTTLTVADGSGITAPPSPSRLARTEHNGTFAYTFAGWSIASDSDVYFDFDTATVTENITLFAQWKTDYVFEAEDLDWDGYNGWGFSGNAVGTDVITPSDGSADFASNGRYTYCLNKNGTTLDFEFTSDRAITGVRLQLMLSAEIRNITLVPYGDEENEGVFIVDVNNEELDYGSYAITDVPSQSSGLIRPFTPLELTIDLLKGENHVRLIVSNTFGQGGTMESTAPMIDCIKILETTAVLNFTPVEGNY